MIDYLRTWNKVLFYFVVQLLIVVYSIHCILISIKTCRPKGTEKLIPIFVAPSDIRPKIQNVPVHYAVKVRAFGVIGIISSYTLL